MTKQKRKKVKLVTPDDYFAWGPFELARFGKTTVTKSHLTAERLAEAQARMAERFPTLVAELDAGVVHCAPDSAFAARDPASSGLVGIRNYKLGHWREGNA